jgi:hypothetical protein
VNGKDAPVEKADPSADDRRGAECPPGRWRGREGGGVLEHPVAIVWGCALGVTAYAAAGRRVVVPQLGCPGCRRPLWRWGGYWRWVRGRDGERRVWVRRGRCPACRRSHALLPDFVLVRRLDPVEVVGRALALAAGGVGLRRVAAQIGVPFTTARSWWRRFRARAPTLVAALVALAVGLDGAPVELLGDGASAAVDALAVAWGRARSRWGERVGEPWRFWNRVTGGAALATTTGAPLARGGAGAWMAAPR